ncbi:hypothetical protein [Actinoplanes sp. NPDC049265]|uniref:hypothetical protein n=1 Tax=Actinoplanes sp. NPDC049265 TaxID=3363902 RepID=UPI0037232B58
MDARPDGWDAAEVRMWAGVAGVVLVLLSGCSVGVGVGVEHGGGPEAPVRPPDYSTPLRESDCVTQAGGGWHKVACSAPEAQAQVTKVSTAEGNQRFTSRPDCPPRTDLALSQPGNVGGTSTLGYFCARNLREPHPGDPGRGGGTIDAGDCVNVDGKSIDEVPCDGSGGTPRYQLTQISPKPCPHGTDQSFSLGRVFAGVPEGGYACGKKL